MLYLTIEEYAKKHNKNVELVKAYLKQNRIPYARQKDGVWEIPSEAPWPSPAPHAFRNPITGTTE